MSSALDIIDATCNMATCANRGTYVLPARCTNCSWEGHVRQTKTHSDTRWRCPNCECKEVQRDFRPREEALG